MSKLYSEHYQAVCLDIQAMIEQRVGRNLNQQELLGIWNADSLMMLELVNRDLSQAQSDADLLTILQRNAAVFGERFTSAKLQAESLINQHKFRSALYRHRKRLTLAQNIHDIMKITERYT